MSNNDPGKVIYSKQAQSFLRHGMKKVLLAIIIPCTLQAQVWKWAYPVISTGQTQVNCVAAGSSGHGYITGQIASSGTFAGSGGSIQTNNQGAFVARYDKNGNVTWVSGGWNGSATMYSFALDKPGNSFLTGNFGGTAFFGTIPDTLQRTSYAGTGDAFLAKLDHTGKAKFLVTEGDSCDDSGMIVAKLDNDELVYCSWDVTQCSPMGGAATSYFRKMDAITAAILWTLTPVTGLWHPVITSTRDNGFLYWGHYFGDSAVFTGQSTRIKMPASNGGDVALVKFDNAGEILWAFKTNGLGDQFCLGGVIVDEQDQIILHIQSPGGFDFAGHIFLSANPALTDHVIKLDGSGNYMNHLTFGSKTAINDVKCDRKGNIYLATSTAAKFDVGADTITIAPTTPGAAQTIIKLTPGLKYVWSNFLTGNGNGRGRIAPTDSVVYYALATDGTVCVVIDGATKKFENGIDYKTFVAAMSNTAGEVTGIRSETIPVCRIYPNPGTSRVNLEFLQPQTGAVILSSVDGRALVRREITACASMSIDTGELPKGIYLLKLETAQGNFSRKLVVE